MVNSDRRDDGKFSMILVELLLTNPFNPFNEFKGMVNCIVVGIMYILMGVCKECKERKNKFTMKFVVARLN
jgi:hypothetical protein